MAIRKVRINTKSLSYNKTKLGMMNERDMAKTETTIKAETAKNHTAQIRTAQELSNLEKYRFG